MKRELFYSHFDEFDIDAAWNEIGHHILQWNFEAARILAEEFIERDHPAFDLCGTFTKAQCHLQFGDWKRAIAEIELNQRPRDCPQAIAFLHANCYERAGDLKTAARILRSARIEGVIDNRFLPVLYKALYKYEEGQHNFKEAEDVCDEMLLLPNLLDRDRAFAYYEKSSCIRVTLPRDPESHGQRLREMVDCCNNVLHLNPSDSIKIDVILARAWARLLMNHFLDAVDDASVAISEFDVEYPSSMVYRVHEAYMLRACCFQKLNNPRLAFLDALQANSLGKYLANASCVATRMFRRYDVPVSKEEYFGRETNGNGSSL